MVNLNGIEFKPCGSSHDIVVLVRKCPWCGKEHSITANAKSLKQGIADIQRGALVQDAFPSFSADEREFLITGICSKCWSSM